MSASIANLSDFRKRKAKARVFLALEHLYSEVLTHLENEQAQIDPEEFEEFIVQVLGDHLVGDLDTFQGMGQVDEHYRRFDERLRKCLQTKIKALGHFQTIRRDSRSGQ